MKKRVKLKRANSSRRNHITKQKSHSIPVVLFTLVLIVIVYAGLMNVFDKLLTSNITGNAVSESGLGSGDMIFSLFLIAILFAIFLFFIYQIKLNKKRK